jgi:hypothetical protein
MAAYTTINDPELYFQTKLYTGDGSTQSITLDGSEDMQPDFVWIKSRADTNPHTLVDSVRGATKIIWTNVNSTEGTYTDEVTAFNSNGFSLGASSNAYTNENTETYVSWNWKESATAGFDIVLYTGTGSNLDASHNLSAVPDFFMIKQRSYDQAWRVYHKNMTTADPYSNRMVISEDGAETTSALGLDADPTSSVINIGTGTGCTNDNGETYVSYLWAEKQGFSKFGIYTGNGSTDGTFIYTGFRPAFLMVKRTSSTENWYMKDNKRDPYNEMNQSVLYANGNAAEDTGGAWLKGDATANGFKIRINDTSSNGSGSTYIYMAFAEAPFVNSEGVPCNAR